MECPCAGTPHKADTVTFRAVLPFAGGMAAMVAMSTAPQDAKGQILALDLGIALFPVYLAHAVEAWTFVDAEGAPVPVGSAADAALPFGTKYEIADAADDLFGGEVTAPFGRKRPTSSPPGPTGVSTPQTPPSGRKRRSRSAPSLPAVSAGSGP